MKTWIKRTLIGSLATSLLLGGGLAAMAQRHHAGWDPAAMRARMIDRVADRLELDAGQRARLAHVGDVLHAQRTALMGDSDPRADLQSVMQGPSFDRTRAGALVQSRVAALQTGSPAVVDALADFYDSLNPAQQSKVREFMASRDGWHGGLHGHAGNRAAEPNG